MTAALNRSGRLPIEAYEAVKAQVNAYDVAAWLDLEPSRERHKFACVWCESSDAMHVYDDGAKCFSCNASGTVIDMVAARRGVEAADAVRLLADRFGVMILDTPENARERPKSDKHRNDAVWGQPKADRAKAPPSRSRPEVPPEQVAARQEVYGALVETLTLTDRGAKYLASRGFTDDLTKREFRSIDGRQDWATAWRRLRDRFTEERLLETLTPLREKRGTDDPERYGLPWGGKAAALVIPYRYHGATVAVRFRKIDPPRHKHDRYLDLAASKSPLPFGADALDGVAGENLHICEGELDTWTMRVVCAPPLHAIGVPGVGQLPIGPWMLEAGKAKRILCWHDRDKAGGEGATRLLAALREANGWSWQEARERVKRVNVQRGEEKADVNDLFVAGDLAGVLVRLGVVP